MKTPEQALAALKAELATSDPTVPRPTGGFLSARELTAFFGRSPAWVGRMLTTLRLRGSVEIVRGRIPGYSGSIPLYRHPAWAGDPKKSSAPKKAR